MYMLASIWPVCTIDHSIIWCVCVCVFRFRQRAPLSRVRMAAGAYKSPGDSRVNVAWAMVEIGASMVR